jgi:transcription-repair coupling factor (superfamily II helicase)
VGGFAWGLFRGGTPVKFVLLPAMLEAFERVWAEVEALPRPVVVRGLRGSAPHAFWAAVIQKTSQRGLILTPDREAAARLLADVRIFLRGQGPMALWPQARHSSRRQAEALLAERSTALQDFLSHDSFWLITYPEALHDRLPPPQTWHANRLTLTPDSTVDRAFLIELLEELGFTETDAVTEPGMYARRGGVIDLFSFAHPYPARLRLEGDTIVKLQRFSPETQLSEGEIPLYHILPSPLTFSEGEKATLLDYLPPDTLIGFTNSLGIRAALQRLEDDELLAAVERLLPKAIQVSLEPWGEVAAAYEYETQPQPTLPQDVAFIQRHFTELAVEKLYLFIENERHRPRLERLFREIPVSYSVEWVVGQISEGFIDVRAWLAYYAEHQIFKRFYQPPEHRRFRRSEALLLRELEELSIGDYVVHKQYGIAKFGGLCGLPQRPEQEAVKLIFADDAVLYVPIHQLSEIARYRSPHSTPPKLSRLGSQEWKRTTEKIRSRIRELAIDLVRLYAQRKVAPGYAFGADTLAQLEMEAQFPYEETPDQLEAIAEVKRDMESPHPMERLICGDVGFGKTEVALRAAFKAVQEGKQVALLVPTTVLAMQHTRTFRERLRHWPIRIATLTRLQSPKEQKATIRALAAGEIDIVIGTHRLISKDVEFKDLGLLIIDEEHRFGVADKEKLRARWPLVDTLFLTATPIPRTLQMALSGLRDVSIIRTPPKGRLPVETHVAPFSWELVKEVLERELRREGQAFFVHHAIEGLPRLTEKIKGLLPEAEVAYVHAQMPGPQVEAILTAFLARQLDILVSTPIVESGLDVPYANTMVVYPAHRFGLSELHQLRGRVGRRDRQAYCYLLVPSLHHLSPEALRRLETLEEFSDLGAGFQIALRDLELRGAGDLFGAEQSGFIHAVGYEYYQELLEEAIMEVKAELEVPHEGLSQRKGPQCTVEADWPAQIPSDWIPHPAARLDIYRQLSSTDNEAALQELLRSLIDRFGDLPEPVLTLADVLRLRWLGDELGLRAIRVHKSQMRVEFREAPPGAILLKALHQMRGVQFSLHNEGERVGVTWRPVSHPKEALVLLSELAETLQNPSTLPAF